jgi:kinesin family member 5
VRDLLDVTKSDLSLREGKAGYYIENLTERYVGERGELRALIAQGQRNRITCATKMN